MKQNRQRSRRKDRKGLLTLVLLVAVFGGIAFLVASPPGSHPVTQNQGTLGEDVFFGSVVNVPFTGKTTGTVKADTNCKPVEQGLTSCVAIIIASDGTELHFSYTHDMSKQECLAAGNQVTIALLDDETVKVVRG
jgi:hypothetical protein